MTITRGEEEVWEGGRPESGSRCVKLGFPDSIWGRCLPASWEPGRGQRGHKHPSQREVVEALGTSHVAREGEERIEGSACA